MSSHNESVFSHVTVKEKGGAVWRGWEEKQRIKRGKKKKRSSSEKS